jgi:hypothetical protein
MEKKTNISVKNIAINYQMSYSIKHFSLILAARGDTVVGHLSTSVGPPPDNRSILFYTLLLHSSFLAPCEVGGHPKDLCRKRKPSIFRFVVFSSFRRRGTQRQINLPDG